MVALLSVWVREKTEAVLSVQNSGSGIPEEDLPKVFDRFFRSDTSRKNSGDSYGLGLSIAKSGIDKIGGKIKVESIKNEKTVFIVKIPVWFRHSRFPKGSAVIIT